MRLTRPWFFICTPTIGTLKLGRLSAAQSGRILGVAARSVKSVAAVQASGAKARWRH
ncbi:MAG: hypothetical protein JSR77_10745 [Planctomycetes bacterium]|nr:hypothetical protein [Planctomycetota bacterium]